MVNEISSDSEDAASRRNIRDRRSHDTSGVPSMRSSNLRERFLFAEQSRSRDQSTASSREERNATDTEDGPDAARTSGFGASDSGFQASQLAQLNSSNALSDRVSAAEAISPEIVSHSVEAALAAADAVEDLLSPDVSEKARKAAFRLIESVSGHPELSMDSRMHIFQMVVRRVSASDTYLQVGVISRLSEHGRRPEPFANNLIEYLDGLVETQYESASEARKRAKSNGERSRTLLLEERGLHQLLTLASCILHSSPSVVQGDALVRLLRATVIVAEKTTSKADMTRAVGVLRAAITAGKIPDEELRPCVEVLSAIANAIPDLNQLAWVCLMLVLNSDQSEQMVTILLSTLSLAPTERHTHTVCGVLSVLMQLVSPDRGPSLPEVKFSTLIDSLWEVHYASRKIRRDSLRTIGRLLRDDRLTEDVLSCRWEYLVQIIFTTVSDKIYDHNGNAEPLLIRDPDVPVPTEQGRDGAETPGERALAHDILDELEQVADVFASLWLRLSPDQKQLAGMYFYKLRLVLPPARTQTLLQQLNEDKYFSVETTNWQSHQLEILRIFLWDHEMNSDTACLILRLLAEALAGAKEGDLEHYHMVALRARNALQNQLTESVAAELAIFTTLAWKLKVPSQLKSDLEVFGFLFETPCNGTASSNDKDSTTVPVNRAATAFVDLFLSYMENQLESAVTLYEFLIRVAKCEDCVPTARLAVLRLLVRLRCRTTGEILVISTPDSLGLAEVLNRYDSAVDHAEVNSNGRMSVQEEHLTPRQSRISGFQQSSQQSLRSSTRISGAQDRTQKSEASSALWMYPREPDLPRSPPELKEPCLFSFPKEGADRTILKTSEWLIAVIQILQQGGNWEIYSYIISHLPSQLSNPSFFTHAIPHIRMLRSIVVSQLLNESFQEPPAGSGLKKGDVAFCLLDGLTMLLGYSEFFARAEQDDVVRAFFAGISGWDRTPKMCIQGLEIAAHQIPTSVGRALQKILFRMSQIITQSQLSVDILEFLGGLARLPHIYANFREDDYRLVFGICVKYLGHSREQRSKLKNAELAADHSLNRASGVSAKSVSTSESGLAMDIQKEVPQYVFALAHHVITIWFLSLRISDRPNHVRWITTNLVWTDQHYNQVMEEQSQVTLDMMHRTTYLDLGETVHAPSFQASDGRTMKKTWLVGMSIVTIETATHTGLTILTKRQASGTTYASYQPQTAPLPPHHVESSQEPQEDAIAVLPNHVFLQLTSTIAPTPTPMEPICLPDDDIVRRALSSFDRNDTVDGYKIGVIYVGPEQADEAEILANEGGSAMYENFLQGLGTKVRLKDAKFNTQGLDRQMDTDGEYTYAWRDRIAEIVFHVTTMMPTNGENDAACTLKKRHIGNDFVNVIFNESGHPFRFDTIASQFNYVNIVVTPESCQDTEVSPPQPSEDEAAVSPTSSPYFTIQTFTNSSMPSISPAASYKLVTLRNLSGLVRQISLNASVFSNVWANRDGGEHISSWRNRLREIARLRERFGNAVTPSAGEMNSDGRSGKSYQPGDRFTGKVAMGGLSEEEGILGSLDFSRWAGPNPPLR